MRVEVSPEAARLVRQLGGRLWVWAARPRLCCGGTPAYLYAGAERPSGLSGFRLVPQTGQDAVEVWFRAPAGRVPDLLKSACAAGAGRGWRPTGMAAGSRFDAAPPVSSSGGPI